MFTVGSKPEGRSPYGAFNMVGNSNEWVADRYDPTFYAVSPWRNPRGPAVGANRVYRGGATGTRASGLRASKRSSYSVNVAGNSKAVRCARDAQ